jgi:hypothetical protein
MQKHSSIFFLCWAICFPGWSQAEPVMVASDITCVTWTMGKKDKGAKLAESHLIGLLDGLSAGRQIPFWNFKDGMSLQQVYAWMDNYCANNPDSSLYFGAYELINEHTEGLFGKHKPGSR